MLKKKDKIVSFLGIFLIFYGLFAILYSLHRGHSTWIFWFCYMGMILTGIGALRRDSLLVSSQFNILFFPLLFWNIDFFLILFTGNSYLGITNYFFNEMLLTARIISFEHLFLIPITLFLVYNILKETKSKLCLDRIKYSFVISFIQVSLIYLVMRILNAKEDNINCVFENCYVFFEPILHYAHYSVLWFLIYFSMILVSNLLLYGIFKIFIKRKKSF